MPILKFTTRNGDSKETADIVRWGNQNEDKRKNYLERKEASTKAFHEMGYKVTKRNDPYSLVGARFFSQKEVPQIEYNIERKKAEEVIDSMNTLFPFP